MHKKTFYHHYEQWQRYPLGIDVLNEIIKDFEIISYKKNNDLVSTYRYQSFKDALFKKFFLFIIKKSSSLDKNNPSLNCYDMISLEKKHNYNYIKNKNINLNGLDDEMVLFDQEFKKWATISKFYSGFYKEFILSTKEDRLNKINENLITNISHIIDIEKKIININ